MYVIPSQIASKEKSFLLTNVLNGACAGPNPFLSLSFSVSDFTGRPEWALSAHNKLEIIIHKKGPLVSLSISIYRSISPLFLYFSIHGLFPVDMFDTRINQTGIITVRNKILFFKRQLSI